MADNPRLSAPARSDEYLADAILRMVTALGKRAREADPDTAVYFRLIQERIDQELALAVASWRRNFSDGQIASELGVTKQAVQKRWPR